MYTDLVGVERTQGMIYRWFKCPICGTQMMIPKRRKGGNEKGHIKTMYCIICEQNRDFVLIDWERHNG